MNLDRLPAEYRRPSGFYYMPEMIAMSSSSSNDGHSNSSDLAFANLYHAQQLAR